MHLRTLALTMAALILVMPSVCATDVYVSIPNKYQEIGVGGTLFFKVDLHDHQIVGRHDISLKYDVMKGATVIVSSKELRAMETQMSFLNSITVPDSAESGLYDIVVTVNDNESASAAFYIKGLDPGGVTDFYVVIVFVIVVIGGLALYEIDRIRRGIERQGGLIKVNISQPVR